MKNKKLFLLLRTLSSKEMEQFGDFLASPYFNKNKKILTLWDLLKNYAVHYEDERLQLYETYETIYDHPPSVEAAFRATTMLLKEFLAYNRLKNKPFYQRHLLLEELLEKKVHKEFEGIYQATIQKMEDSKVQNAALFLPKFLIEYNKVQQLLQIGNKMDKLTVGVSSSLESLDKFYLSHKLVLSAALSSFQKIKGTAVPNSELIEAITEKLKDGWQEEEPAIKILYLGLCIVEEGKDDDFFALLKLLKEQAESLSSRQLRDSYTLAANHCIKRIREGQDLYGTLFSIYEAILQHNTNTLEEYLSRDFLKNLVTTGCRLQKYEETRKIIHQYHHQIAPEYQASVFHFNLGIVDYFEGKYECAIKRFTDAQAYKNIYGIEAQIILLKIYYLTEETMAFPSLLKALKERISTSKIVGKQRKSGYKNFCRIINPMFKLKTDPTYRKSLKSIHGMLVKYPSAGNMNWLEEQLELLER